MQDIPLIFFGGEPLGVPILEELHACGLVPRAVVCSPDKPVGRKQIVTPPPVKVWAQESKIEVWQPESWRGDAARKNAEHFFAPHLTKHPDLVFVVVAYNHILPQWLLDLSPRGVINVHPSLLPKLRGASPIRTAIKDDLRDQIGVSIMLLDDQMDHGPILAQMTMQISDKNWPIPGPRLDLALARMGGSLLADTLPAYLAGSTTPVEQNHDAATYCGKLTKTDSEFQLDPCNLPTGSDAWRAWLYIHAFAGTGDTWFKHNGQRIKITKAQLVKDQLRLVTVVPAGKPAQDFTTWHHTICTERACQSDGTD